MDNLTWSTILAALLSSVVTSLFWLEVHEKPIEITQRAVFKQDHKQIFKFVTDPTTTNEWLPAVKYARGDQDSGTRLIVFETGYSESYKAFVL